MKTQDALYKNVRMMHERKFIVFDEGSNSIRLDSTDERQVIAHTFLYSLITPFIESYFVTMMYFTNSQNRSALNDEKSVYLQIQWMSEIFLKDGITKF